MFDGYKQPKNGITTNGIMNIIKQCIKQKESNILSFVMFNVIIGEERDSYKFTPNDELLQSRVPKEVRHLV